MGEGWYDTGDIVDIDSDGYLHIVGRAKRFAKVGGEMVSLSMVEELALQTWPKRQHAALSIPDAAKGEVIILITEEPNPERSALVKTARENGIGEMNVPRRVIHTKTVPLLGSGKINYPAVEALFNQTEVS